MSIREIQFHLAETLGFELSHKTINNITEKVIDEVIHWQHRPLNAFYPVISMDAIVVKIRGQNRVQNRAVHIAVSVDTDGMRHVLEIWVQSHEGAKFCAGVSAELANCGTQDAFIVTCDGLTGFLEVIDGSQPGSCLTRTVKPLALS